MFPSAELVIKNNKTSRVRGEVREKSSSSAPHSEKTRKNTSIKLEADVKCCELNNNSIQIDQSDPPQQQSSDTAVIIQNQCDILNTAVKNILAVSSENIYATKRAAVVKTPGLKYVSTENILGNENSLTSIVEDLEFKEALFRFSEESLSMSAENILSSSLKNISKKSRSKAAYKSLHTNTFPMIAEGKIIFKFWAGNKILLEYFQNIFEWLEDW